MFKREAYINASDTIKQLNCIIRMFTDCIIRMFKREVYINACDAIKQLNCIISMFKKAELHQLHFLNLHHSYF